jgi:hypothetical protein
VAVNNPATCDTAVTPTPQRSLASRRRPLAGPYSVTGKDAESKSRIDLMLSTIRRPGCDTGARMDAWAVQIDSMKFTSLHVTSPVCYYFVGGGGLRCAI